MKAISLLQPWASLMVLGEKRIETRSASSPAIYIVPGEWYAIHASKSTREMDAFHDPAFRAAFSRHGITSSDQLPHSAIIGAVRFVRRLPTDSNELLAIVTDLEEQFGDYSPGRVGLVSDACWAAPEPIPCRGALGLWNVPDDLARKVEVPA